jgi:hypothetical protein
MMTIDKDERPKARLQGKELDGDGQWVIVDEVDPKDVKRLKEVNGDLSKIVIEVRY